MFRILKNFNIEYFNWRKAFEFLSVDSKVDLLNETLLNIFRNYIPNKKIKCYYRQASWMTYDIKAYLKERSKLTKIYHKNGRQKSNYDKVLEKFADCTKKITQAKNDYINKMTNSLQNPSTASKTYWAILSCLLYNKKNLAIPSLVVDGKLVPGFCEKANLFNIFFSSICTQIQNTSILSPFLYRTNARITSFHVTEEDILLIIKALDSSKARG